MSVYNPADYGRHRPKDRRATRRRRLDLAGNDGPFDRHKRDMTLRRLLSLDVAGKSVLDVGPGPGGNLRALREAGAAKIIGCDITPKMVELAQFNLGADAGIRLLDGPRLPIPDPSVDVAFTVTALHRNPEEVAQALIGGIARVSRETAELIEDTTSFWPRGYHDRYFVRDTNLYIEPVTAQRLGAGAHS